MSFYVYRVYFKTCMEQILFLFDRHLPAAVLKARKFTEDTPAFRRHFSWERH